MARSHPSCASGTPTHPPTPVAQVSRTFSHITCEVGAYEAEEVGVEHLLRDINDPSLSSLGGELRGKLGGLEGLGECARAEAPPAAGKCALALRWLQRLTSLRRAP